MRRSPRKGASGTDTGEGFTKKGFWWVSVNKGQEKPKKVKGNVAGHWDLHNR